MLLPLHNTKAGVSSPSLHFAQAKEIAKVVPAFYKMVQAADLDTLAMSRPSSVENQGPFEHHFKSLWFRVVQVHAVGNQTKILS